MSRALLAVLLVCSSVAADEEKKDDPVAKLVQGLKSKDAKVRAASAEGLQKLGADATEAAPALCEALLDLTPKVRIAALQAIEKVRPDLYKPLSQIVLDGSSSTAAVKELGIMEEKAIAAAPVIRVVLKNGLARVVSAKGGSLGKNLVPDSIPVSITALGQIGAKDIETSKLIATTGGNTFHNHTVRLLGLRAFRGMADKDESLRKQYYGLCKAAIDDQKCILEAIDGLSTFKSDAKEMLPLLKKLKLLKDENIREAATKAVEAIETP